MPFYLGPEDALQNPILMFHPDATLLLLVQQLVRRRQPPQADVTPQASHPAPARQILNCGSPSGAREQAEHRWVGKADCSSSATWRSWAAGRRAPNQHHPVISFLMKL